MALTENDDGDDEEDVFFTFLNTIVFFPLSFFSLRPKPAI